MKSMTLPAKLENLEPFQDFISQCASDFQMAAGRIQKIRLAVEETLVNIFSYAYPDDDQGEVTVSCSLENGRDFRMMFEDRGQPFDMLAKEDPDTTLSLEDRGIGGLGIFFVKQMMDAVDYSRKDGKNVLILTLALT